MMMWYRGAVVITTVQFHSTKPELSFCECSNPARGMSEIRDGEISDNGPEYLSSINVPKKQFIIIIIIIIMRNDNLETAIIRILRLEFAGHESGDESD